MTARRFADRAFEAHLMHHDALGGEALLEEKTRMKLLTRELRKRLPRLYETENLPSCKEMMALAKFFSPDSG